MEQNDHPVFVSFGQVRDFDEIQQSSRPYTDNS